MQEETSESTPSSLCLPARCRHTSFSLLPLWVECPCVTRPPRECLSHPFHHCHCCPELSPIPSSIWFLTDLTWPSSRYSDSVVPFQEKQNKTKTASKIARPPCFQTSLPIFLWTYFKLALIPTAPLKLLCRCPHSFEGQINSETSSLDLDTRHSCSLHGLHGALDPFLHQGVAFCLDWFLVSLVFQTLRVLRGRVSDLLLCLYSLTSWVNSEPRVLMSLIPECLWVSNLWSRFISLAALLASPSGSVPTTSMPHLITPHKVFLVSCFCKINSAFIVALTQALKVILKMYLFIWYSVHQKSL